MGFWLIFLIFIPILGLFYILISAVLLAKRLLGYGDIRFRRFGGYKI
jgi:hypothetical protein